MPQRVVNHTLSLGELFDRALTVCVALWRPLLFVGMVGFAPALAQHWSLSQLWLMKGASETRSVTPLTLAYAASERAAGSAGAARWLDLWLVLLAWALATAVSAVMIDRALRDRETGVRSALGVVNRRWPVILIASIVGASLETGLAAFIPVAWRSATSSMGMQSRAFDGFVYLLGVLTELFVYKLLEITVILAIAAAALSGRTLATAARAFRRAIRPVGRPLRFLSLTLALVAVGVGQMVVYSLDFATLISTHSASLETAVFAVGESIVVYTSAVVVIAFVDAQRVPARMRRAEEASSVFAKSTLPLESR